MPKYSIVIPTYNHLEDCLKPCIESLIKYTDFKDVELVIVANGCKDGTHEYLTDLHNKGVFPYFSWLKFDEGIGYSKATNEGIMASIGEFIILLNNDIVLLPQEKNTWIEMLVKPFLSDEKVGITGPIKGPSGPANREFIIFFCAMVKKELFDKIGLLDEIFTPGGGEDTDFCIKAEDIGYKTVQVPERPTTYNGERIVGGFPIYHHGEATVGGLENWKGIFDRNSRILAERYNHQWKLGNDCERAVISKTDDLTRFKREYTRYKWASDRIKEGDKVLEIGCSSGYGIKLFPKGIEYTGLDYCEDVLKFAKENFGDDLHKFVVADITKEFFGIQVDMFYDVIIAFEVLEHIDNGKELAQELKKHCKKLLITTPYKEIPGLWGRHHKLHQLDESHFPGFNRVFVSDDGRIIDKPERFDGMNLLLMEWEEGKTYVDAQRKPTVLCSISTKDRYDILPLAIQSICSQTVVPDKLVIFDDNSEPKDLRQIDTYKYLFSLLDSKRIQWQVIFGKKKGQHFNHQIANKMGYDLVWRLDDDEFAEHDVLEKLLSHMKEGIGAVAPAVIMPGGESKGGTNKIEDIFHTPNLQWAKDQGIHEVDHLYSSFLYRAGVVDFCTDLSPVAHREETIFSHELKRKGYKLIVDTSAVIYHYRQSTGGIRSHNNQWFYEHDEKIFLKKLESWGYFVVVLNNGLGDHLAFSNVLPALMKKHNRLIIGCCYPEVFQSFNVKIVPVGSVMGLKPDENIYKFMSDNNWKKSIVEAYSAYYGVEI
jgi:GT2 family glycosyltransferase